MRSKEQLEPFVKDFYKDRELPHIKNMTKEEVDRIREDCQMKIFGKNIPNPVSTFEETTLDGNTEKHQCFHYFLYTNFFLRQYD